MAIPDVVPAERAPAAPGTSSGRPPPRVEGSDTVVAGLLDAAAAGMAARVVEEDSRIATGLADTVIRDLFAAGMRMQGLMPRAGDEVQDDLTEVVADLDRIIREIRDVVFGLDPRREPVGSEARRR